MIKIEKVEYISGVRYYVGGSCLTPDDIIELYGLLAPIAAEIVNQRSRADKTEPKKRELE